MKIFSEELVAEACREQHVADLSNATIGEVLLVAQYLEAKTGIPFIRMDQGSPGLPMNRYLANGNNRSVKPTTQQFLDIVLDSHFLFNQGP